MNKLWNVQQLQCELCAHCSLQVMAGRRTCMIVAVGAVDVSPYHVNDRPFRQSDNLTAICVQTSSAAEWSWKGGLSSSHIATGLAGQAKQAAGGVCARMGSNGHAWHALPTGASARMSWPRRS